MGERDRQGRWRWRLNPDSGLRRVEFRDSANELEMSEEFREGMGRRLGDEKGWARRNLSGREG